MSVGMPERPAPVLVRLGVTLPTLVAAAVSADMHQRCVVEYLRSRGCRQLDVETELPGMMATVRLLARQGGAGAVPGGAAGCADGRQGAAGVCATGGPAYGSAWDRHIIFTNSSIEMRPL